MTFRSTVVAALVGVTIPFPFAHAASGQLPSSGGEYLALVGGTVHVSPADEPIPDAVVLIQDGKILAVGDRASVEVPRRAESLDCAGLVITAGFWNSHVHFFERKWASATTIPAPELGRQLEAMLTRYGFTSVFDTGSMWENTRGLRDRIESGEVPGPRIRSTGEVLIAPSALPPELVFRLMGLMSVPSPEIADAAQAATASRALLDAGVNGIKVHLQPPPPPHPPISGMALAAAVSEAHRSGRTVFAHPNTGADVLAAVRAGVDVIAHTTPGSGAWDDALLGAVGERRVALTPTLTLWKYFMRHDRLSIQEGMVDTAIEQLRDWIGAGGTVLFGTDIGAVDYDPREEYALMARAGMGFRQILASLTVAPAEHFGESERLGRVAAGLEADLVVLQGDPGTDVRALAAVKYTLRGGKVIYHRSDGL